MNNQDNKAAEAAQPASTDIHALIERAQKIAPSLATRTYELTAVQVGYIIGASAAAENFPAATSGDAPADLQQLKALALAATPQDFDSAEIKREGGWIECPVCNGDGEVEAGKDYCNYDQKALGAHFYGIGDAHVKAEAYYRAVRPAVVLDLIARIESAAAPAPSDEIAQWEGLTDLFGVIAAKHGINDIQVNGGTADELFPRALAEFIVAASRSNNEDGARFRWLNEDHADAEVREQARSLAKRLGTSSYFAITRDIDAAMGVRAAVSAATKPTADLSKLKKLVLDVSNTSYRCGQLSASDEESPEAYAKASAADQAIIDYVQSLLATKPAAQAVPEGGAA